MPGCEPARRTLVHADGGDVQRRRAAVDEDELRHLVEQALVVGVVGAEGR